MKAEEIMKKAIDHYGMSAQLDMVIEEMAELTQAINKFKRYGKSNILEEMADVSIMLDQMKIMLDITDDELEAEKYVKLKRLEERLKETL